MDSYEHEPDLAEVLDGFEIASLEENIFTEDLARQLLKPKSTESIRRSCDVAPDGSYIVYRTKSDGSGPMSSTVTVELYTSVDPDPIFSQTLDRHNKSERLPYPKIEDMAESQRVISGLISEGNLSTSAREVAGYIHSVITNINSGQSMNGLEDILSPQTGKSYYVAEIVEELLIDRDEGELQIQQYELPLGDENSAPGTDHDLLSIAKYQPFGNAYLVMQESDPHFQMTYYESASGLTYQYTRTHGNKFGMKVLSGKREVFEIDKQGDPILSDQSIPPSNFFIRKLAGSILEALAFEAWSEAKRDAAEIAEDRQPKANESEPSS